MVDSLLEPYWQGGLDKKYFSNFGHFWGSGAQLSYLGILGWKNIFCNIFCKNKDTETPDSFLEPYWQGGPDENNFFENLGILGGLGPNFLIWAFWAKNQIWALIKLKCVYN